MRNWHLTVALIGLGLLAGAAFAEDIESFTLKPEDVKRTSVEFKRDGSAMLECTLTKSKATEFAQTTERNLGKKLRLMIGGNAISEPLVREKITGGLLSVQIKTTDEAVELAKCLMKELPDETPEVPR